jgi:hypothetical protein
VTRSRMGAPATRSPGRLRASETALMVQGMRPVLSSGCHVTELRECAWTLPPNFGRTSGAAFDGL